VPLNSGTVSLATIWRQLPLTTLAFAQPYLDDDLHGSGFRTLKTSPVNPALTWFTPRLVETGMAKGQYRSCSDSISITNKSEALLSSKLLRISRPQ
jgi:hypothetical protein